MSASSFSVYFCLLLLSATGLRHSLLNSSQLILPKATLLFSSHLALRNRSASFSTLLFLSCLTHSNRSASFSTLLFLSPLTLSKRSASFFSLLLLSCLTLSHRSASFICRIQTTLHQTLDAVVSQSDRRCRRHCIRQV